MVKLTIEQAFDQLLKAGHLSDYPLLKTGTISEEDIRKPEYRTSFETTEDFIRYSKNAYDQADIGVRRSGEAVSNEAVLIQLYKNRPTREHTHLGPSYSAEYDLAIAAVRLQQLSEEGKTPDLATPAAFNKFVSQAITYAHYRKEKQDTPWYYPRVKDDGERPMQALFARPEVAAQPTTQPEATPPPPSQDTTVTQPQDTTTISPQDTTAGHSGSKTMTGQITFKKGDKAIDIAVTEIFGNPEATPPVQGITPEIEKLYDPVFAAYAAALQGSATPTAIRQNFTNNLSAATTDAERQSISTALALYERATEIGQKQVQETDVNKTITLDRISTKAELDTYVSNAVEAAKLTVKPPVTPEVTSGVDTAAGVAPAADTARADSVVTPTSDTASINQYITPPAAAPAPAVLRFTANELSYEIVEGELFTGRVPNIPAIGGTMGRDADATRGAVVSIYADSDSDRVVGSQEAKASLYKVWLEAKPLSVAKSDAAIAIVYAQRMAEVYAAKQSDAAKILKLPLSLPALTPQNLAAYQQAAMADAKAAYEAQQAAAITTPAPAVDSAGNAVDTTGAVADTTGITPPADTTRVTPPADTTRVTPPADTTRVTPPADTTRVTPPADTTRVTPPADTTRVTPPADTTRVTPPADTTRVTPPADTTRVTPPASGGQSNTPAPATPTTPAQQNLVPQLPTRKGKATGHRKYEGPADGSRQFAACDDGSVEYTIQKDDTLYRIARDNKDLVAKAKAAFGPEVSEHDAILGLALMIASKNGIKDADMIKCCGSILRMPTEGDITNGVASMKHAKGVLSNDSKISYTGEVKGQNVEDLVSLVAGAIPKGVQQRQ